MIILYHGSDYLFKHFVFKNVGKINGTSGGGFGIYLSDSKEDASMYGKYLYTVEASLRKELSNRKKILTKEQVRAILRKFESVADNSYIENFDGMRPLNWTNEDKALSNLMQYCTTDVDIINDIINATGSGVEMMKVLTSFGYTHTTDLLTASKKNVTNYIIFDLDCLKIQKREKREEALKDLYESENMKTGSQGKSKSKSQRRLMAMALAYKRGKLDKKYASDTIKKMADSMSEETLHDFASTNQKKRKKDGSVGKRNNIPDYVKGSDYRPELKNSKSLKPQVRQKVSKQNSKDNGK